MGVGERTLLWVSDRSGYSPQPFPPRNARLTHRERTKLDRLRVTSATACAECLSNTELVSPAAYVCAEDNHSPPVRATRIWFNQSLRKSFPWGDVRAAEGH